MTTDGFESFEAVLGSQDVVSSDEIKTFDLIIATEGLQQSTEQSLRRQLHRANMSKQELRAKMFDHEREARKHNEEARKLKAQYDEVNAESRMLAEAAYPSKFLHYNS